MSTRLTAERLAEIRYNVQASPAYRVPNAVVVELLAELDAVTGERDDARTERDRKQRQRDDIADERDALRQLVSTENCDESNADCRAFRAHLDAARAQSSDSAASNEEQKPEEVVP